MQRLEGLVFGGAINCSCFRGLLKQLLVPLSTQLADRRSSIVKQPDTAEFEERRTSSGHRPAGGSLSGGTEAAVARDAFEGMIETISRTKESIVRATRHAIDCAKHGIASESGVVGGKRMRRVGGDGVDVGYVAYSGPSGSAGKSHSDKKSKVRSRVDRESDNQQLLQLEEKDVVSTVATVLSDLCGPGDWMPLEKLHAEQ